jgi:hypothetical protein
MSTVAAFFDGISFDAEATSAMGNAYDQVIRSLHDNGQPQVAREIIARRIIEIAKAGERDVEQMRRKTLASFGLASQ